MRSDRSILFGLLGLAVIGCSPVASPQPATIGTPAPTSSPTATPLPSPSATGVPAPSVGHTLTLQDLHATLAYAVCGDRQCDVHVIDADGVDRNVTNTPGDGTEEHQPVFSPDGKRVTFRCPHTPGAEFPNNGNDELCIANVDGSHRRFLTDNEAADYSSDWSPDGKWIAFASTRETGPDLANDIYVTNSAGSDVRRLTVTIGIDEYPVWSRDGTRIAYACTQGRRHASGVGDFETCVITADGENRQRITETPGICHPLDWLPNGTRILVACDPDGNGPADGDLYLVPPAGGRLDRLTSTGGFNAQFTPDGAAVIYSDREGLLYRLALDGSVRSPIELPHIDEFWDLHFLEP